MESPIRGPLPGDLTLIETFGWRQGPGFVNLRRHLARAVSHQAAFTTTDWNHQ